MNQPTVYDFIAWCKNQLDAGALSALMTRFGFQRDDVETIAEAVKNPLFLNEFGALVREAVNAPKDLYATARATGEPTAIDWIKIANSQRLTDGFTLEDAWKSSFGSSTPTANSGGTTGSNAGWDPKIVESISTGASSLFNMISNIFGKTPVPVGNGGGGTGGGTGGNTGAASSSNSFMWIILAVVVIVVVAILWLSLSKKK